MGGETSEGNRRILVIDDNPSIHADFQKTLSGQLRPVDRLAAAESELFGLKAVDKAKRVDFKLTSAFQGEDGVELLREALSNGDRFAMAFVDVRMPPGLDGIQTTALLWKIDPDLQVVVCTAHSDYSWEEMVEKLGHSDRMVILKKPFDPAEVLQLANALTEKWRLLQATKRRMDELEKLVDERTHHLKEANLHLEAEVAWRIDRERCLSLQSDITRFLTNSAAAVDELVTSILHLICERMGWDIGRLWQVDHHANLLRCSVFLDAIGDAADAVRALTTLNSGLGLPGRVWQNGEPEWVGGGSAAEPPPAGARRPADPFPGGFAFPLRLEGEIVGVLEFGSRRARAAEEPMCQMLTAIGSLIGNVVERKKLEEQLRHSQKMDAMGHLASGVAHDFNNILTVIQGYAQILKARPGMEDEAVEALGQVVQAAERAAGLTRQLLTFSRKQILQARTLDLNQVINHLEKMLRRIIGEDIDLAVETCSEPTFIHADEGMVGQILMNLSCNARDAMVAGGRLTIGTESVLVQETDLRHSPEARSGDFVCLKVTDTGCGIASEDLPHIFEPFFTTKDVGRGTGLGLCTVYGIVKQHRGWIEVASRPGAGACFRIFLPRIMTLTRPGEPAGHETTVPGGRETILLVEDEAAVRSLTREYFNHLGYHIIEAKSGLEALSVWESHAGAFDLLLTDIVMPDGINGRDLATRLASVQPALRVVFVSGYNPTDDRENQNLVEGVNFLHKPYSLEKLARVIRACLDTPPSGYLAEAEAGPSGRGAESVSW